MKIVVTGCCGRVGKRVVLQALQQGHTVLGLDTNQPDVQSDDFTFLNVDIRDYEEVLRVFKGCDAVIHLAAFPNPTDYHVQTHNGNVVMSWNILRAAAELGITRIAQASSVNVITMVYSKGPHFEYFPIDEDHPCLPDEPYGLSKVICELQADTIVRRYPATRIASLRLHWSIPSPDVAKNQPMERAKNDLWGYVQEDSGAEAFLLAVTGETGKWEGHERFFVVAPDTAFDAESEELRRRFWPDVPVREGKELAGRSAFFDCSKAARLLGWVHKG